VFLFAYPLFYKDSIPSQTKHFQEIVFLNLMGCVAAMLRDRLEAFAAL
jgi:hypothetical protein